MEIFSLLEEQIPKYKIRADTLTQFAGYENQVRVVFEKVGELLEANLYVYFWRPKRISKYNFSMIYQS